MQSVAPQRVRTLQGKREVAQTPKAKQYHWKISVEKKDQKEKQKRKIKAKEKTPAKAHKQQVLHKSGKPLR